MRILLKASFSSAQILADVASYLVVHTDWLHWNHRLVRLSYSKDMANQQKRKEKKTAGIDRKRDFRWDIYFFNSNMDSSRCRVWMNILMLGRSKILWIHVMFQTIMTLSKILLVSLTYKGYSSFPILPLSSKVACILSEPVFKTHACLQIWGQCQEESSQNSTMWP